MSKILCEQTFEYEAFKVNYDDLDIDELESFSKRYDTNIVKFKSGVDSVFMVGVDAVLENSYIVKMIDEVGDVYLEVFTEHDFVRTFKIIE